MSANAGSRGKKVDPLSKRIPQNPKYSNVKPTVDTGASVSKYMQKIEDIRANFKPKHGDIYKRMKCTTFVHLIIQINSNPELDIPETPASRCYSESARSEITNAELSGLDHGDGSPVPSLYTTESDYGETAELDTQRSTLQSVARGIGELDVNQPEPAPVDQLVNDDCPYLLLDIREGDEYSRCHIITALHYSKSMLSRASNYESKEMLMFKNKPGKVIILYDEDERLAPAATTTLVQRGYDNVFMLSGGLKVALKFFPESLTTGTPPPQIVPPELRLRQNPSGQTMFTPEDIDILYEYFEKAIQDRSIGVSSRLSKAGKKSQMSRATSRSTSSVSSSSTLTGRPPFKS